MRYIESDCRKALEVAEETCKVLEFDMRSTNDRLENTFMLHLGDGPDIPEFLRTAHPLVNRGVEKEDVLDIMRMCIKQSLAEFDGGRYPHLQTIFVEAIKTKYESHTVAEWGRNVLEALESYRTSESDCELIGSILATTVSSHLLLLRANSDAEFGNALSELAQFVVDASGSSQKSAFTVIFNRKDTKALTYQIFLAGVEGASADVVASSKLMEELSHVFPTKSETNIQAISDLLGKAIFENHKINVADILRGEPGSVDAQVEILKLQFSDRLAI